MKYFNKIVKIKDILQMREVGFLELGIYGKLGVMGYNQYLAKGLTLKVFEKLNQNKQKSFTNNFIIKKNQTKYHLIFSCKSSSATISSALYTALKAIT